MTINGIIEKAFKAGFRNAFNATIFKSNSKPLKTYLIVYKKRLFFVNDFELPEITNLSDFVYTIYIPFELFNDMCMPFITNISSDEYQQQYESLNDSFERLIPKFIYYPTELYDKICEAIVNSSIATDSDYEDCIFTLCNSVIDDEIELTIVDSGVLYNFSTEAEEHIRDTKIK